MISDFHCHCLPKMDDGADDVSVSLKMLDMLRRYGVEKVAATPHYSASVEKLDLFLERRERSAELLMSKADLLRLPQIRPGAEVVLEHNLYDTDLKRLCITGTDYLLIEFPYTAHKPWMPQLIENIIYKYSIKPVLAHFERYAGWLTKNDYQLYFSMPDVIIQMNTSVFNSMSGTRFFKSVVAGGSYYALGSDAHNIKSRPPRFEFSGKADRLISKSDNRLIRDLDFKIISNDAGHLII